ncbi:32486_t:CDS:1, partial [Gigaspora margarita]
ISIVNDSYSEQSDIECNYRSKAKKFKHRAFRHNQKLAKLDYTVPKKWTMHMKLIAMMKIVANQKRSKKKELKAPK